MGKRKNKNARRKPQVKNTSKTKKIGKPNWVLKLLTFLLKLFLEITIEKIIEMVMKELLLNLIVLWLIKKTIEMFI